jgi:hypothetical protein
MWYPWGPPCCVNRLFVLKITLKFKTHMPQTWTQRHCNFLHFLCPLTSLLSGAWVQTAIQMLMTSLENNQKTLICSFSYLISGKIILFNFITKKYLPSLHLLSWIARKKFGNKGRFVGSPTGRNVSRSHISSGIQIFTQRGYPMHWIPIPSSNKTTRPMAQQLQSAQQHPKRASSTIPVASLISPPSSTDIRLSIEGLLSPPTDCTASLRSTTVTTLPMEGHAQRNRPSLHAVHSQENSLTCPRHIPTIEMTQDLHSLRTNLEISTSNIQRTCEPMVQRPSQSLPSIRDIDCGTHTCRNVFEVADLDH